MQTNKYPCGYELHGYQKKGADFLVSKSHGLLADEMGLGKTAQTITALDRVRAMRCLIICPSIAKHNWENEFSMWSNEKRIISVKDKLTDPVKPMETVICTFDYASANYEKLSEVNFDAVVVDEAHFLKNVGSKRTKAILGKKGIAHNAKRMWLLTGTPAPNHAGELWVYLYTFGATKLAQDIFINTYCHTQIRRFGNIKPQIKVLGTKKEKIPELKNILKTVCLRRLKKDVMKELPRILYDTEYLDVEPLSHEFLKNTRSFGDWYLPDRRNLLIDKLKTEDLIINQMWEGLQSRRSSDAVKFLQAAAPNVAKLRKYIGLQKAHAIIPYIKSFFESNVNASNAFYGKPDKRKLVIFALHRDAMFYLRDNLQKYKAKMIFGGTQPGRKKRYIEDFQDPEGKTRLLICNIHAAGTAINLTASNCVWFLEMDWVPGNNAQAVMRVHRLGQNRDVMVKVFSCKERIDAQIQQTLRRKTQELTEIFDT